MDKKTRFLNAGGLFETKLTKGFICFAHPCYIHGRQDIVGPKPANIHVHIDPVHAKKVVTIKSEKHYKFILENKSPSYWSASKDRRLLITQGFGDSLTDRHLVNIMRFLIENWQDIRKAYLDAVPDYGGLAQIRRKINETQNAPTFFALVLPCWEALTAEVAVRFGAEALTALLDGF